MKVRLLTKKFSLRVRCRKAKKKENLDNSNKVNSNNSLLEDSIDKFNNNLENIPIVQIHNTCIVHIQKIIMSKQKHAGVYS